MPTDADWWSSVYAGDIVENLRRREDTLPEFMGQSPQLHVRQYLVEWLVAIGNRWGLCTTSVHLAVFLMDHFMDNHDIAESHLQLVALSCLSIAAKFEEKDSLVPRITALNRMTNDAYETSQFIQMELVLLDYFDWDLCVPTAAQYTEYLMAKMFHEGNLCNRLTGNQSNTALLARIRLYVKYFLDKSLQDSTFLKFRPFVVAAACIASTCIYFMFPPSWSLVFQKEIRCSFDSLFMCCSMMLRLTTASFFILVKRIVSGHGQRILERDSKNKKHFTSDD